MPDDEALANAVLDVREVFEDTVYAVAHDVIVILKRYAEVDKAVSGKADLPMLSVLQSIREHIATLVYPRFIGKTPPDALASIERYLHADVLRLNKAKNDKNRDVRWAWEADEAKQLADKAMAKAEREPAGPRHEALRNSTYHCGRRNSARRSRSACSASRKRWANAYHLSHSIAVDTCSFPVSTAMEPNEIILNRTMVSDG